MKIILDSSILIKDFRQIKGITVLLLENLKSLNYSLVIPEVVIEETINKYKEALAEHSGKVQGSIKAIKILRNAFWDDSYKPHDILKLVTEYRNFLENHFKQYSATILPIPQVPHNQLLSRDLNRKKPFSESGKGYRDALIWYSILDYAKSNKGEIVFISSNTNDFSNAEKVDWHADLLKDIKELSNKSVKLTYYSNTTSFLEKYVFPKLPKEKQILINFMKVKGDYCSLEDSLLKILEKPLFEHRVNNADLSLSSDCEDVNVVNLMYADEYSISSDNINSRPEVILNIKGIFTVEIEYYKQDDDAEDSSDPYELTYEEEEVYIEAAVKFNMKTGIVVSSSINKLESTL